MIFAVSVRPDPDQSEKTCDLASVDREGIVPNNLAHGEVFKRSIPQGLAFSFGAHSCHHTVRLTVRVHHRPTMDSRSNL